MKIRKFDKRDAERVCEIIKENNKKITSQFYSARVIRYWNNELVKPEYLVRKRKNRKSFVLEKDKKVIGYICFEKNILKMLFVDQGFQGLGFGKRLVKMAEKEISKSGYCRVIGEPNINSEGFMLSLGFKRKRIIYKKVGKIKIKKFLVEKKIK